MRRQLASGLVLLLVLLVTALAVAQGSGPYLLDWYSIDGGGGVMVAGDFRLAGSVGQADAGELAQDGYELQGGFWSGALPTATPTSTSTATGEPTGTATSTPTATATPAVTSTASVTPSSTATPTPSPTPTSTATPTATSTPTPSAAATATATVTATSTGVVRLIYLPLILR